MIVVDLRHVGTTAWLNEVLKISVRTSVSCAAQSLSTRPGMLSGPAALRGLILDRVFLTSAGDRQSAWSLGGVGSFWCRCVILHFKPWIKVVECIGEGCVIITGLWRGLVVSDGLNGLPQAPCVSAVCEVIVDFRAYDRFAFLMPQDRLALAVCNSFYIKLTSYSIHIFYSHLIFFC